MEKRTHLYVSRNHVLTWLMALCLVGSAVARIAIPCVKGTWDSLNVWSQIILPATAALLYVAIAIFFGQEFFYKTALPVWLFGLACAWQLFSTFAGHRFLWSSCCICIIFFCSLYTAITCGAIRWSWLLLPLYLLALGALTYASHLLPVPTATWNTLIPFLPDYLVIVGLLLLLFSLKVHTDGRYHPTWGDRSDGRRIRSIPALDQISPYIMVHRNEANNLFSESVEISNTERYIRAKRRAGLQNFGLTHVIIAAYVRTVAKYPALNRFISGQKLYTHGEDIQLCMTVKKEMSAQSPDTVLKVHFTPWDTAADVYTKFNAQVEEAKNTPLDSGVDNLAGLLTLIPGLVLKFVVWLLRTLDYFGLVPGFLLELSPFHGSAYFTSMGSLGIRPVYHHLYNFGNMPVFCAFGRKRRATEIVDGEMVEKKYVDLKFTLDERICDGFYYASLIKHFVRLMTHPELLDNPPDEVIQDID